MRRTHACVRLCAFLYCCVLAGPGVAQTPEALSFIRYTSAQGLHALRVTAVAQDTKGFMWAGTSNGLYHFDGYDFTPYPQAQLSHPFINAGQTLLAQEDVLWVGTRGGLNRLDLKTGTGTAFVQDTSAAGLSHNVVTALALEAPHTLWIGTDGGLNRLDLNTGRVSHHLHDPADPASLSYDAVTALALDAQDQLWVGTRQGLNRLDLNTGRLQRVMHNPTDPASLPNNYVTALHLDPQGRLWIGLVDGRVLRFEDTQTAFVVFDPPDEIPTGPIADVVTDAGGTVWVGHRRGGLCRVEEPNQRLSCSERLHPEDATTAQVTSLWVDKGGLLWVGTLNSLYKQRPQQPFRVYTTRSAPQDLRLSANAVLAVRVDPDGVVWVGTDGGGLNRLDPNTATRTIYRAGPDGLSSDHIWALHRDTEGALWIGTAGGGLNRMDRDTGRITHFIHDPQDGNSLPDNRLYSITEDDAGALWLGTVRRGLARLNAARTHFDAPTPLRQGSVWPLLVAPDAPLWAGTLGDGLYRINRSTGQAEAFRQDTTARGLSSDAILALHRSAEALWIGTAGGGLNRMDTATTTVEIYIEADGLGGDDAVCILEDDTGVLWIGTNKGLTRMTPDGPGFTRYTQRDGLPGTLFQPGACHKGPDGTLFFGTAEGLVGFHPDQITLNPHLPPVVLTQFAVHGTPATLDTAIAHIQEIRLPHTENVVTFGFSGLDYANPDKNQYAYRLDGVDQGWIQAGNRRFVNYGNLVPGTYRFEVRAANDDGRWNPEPASVRLVVVPPFTQTWMFKVLVGLGLILMVGLLLTYRWYHRQRARLVQQQISQDLHDNVNNDFVILADTVDDLALVPGRTEADRLHLRTIAGDVRRLSRDLRDIVWLVQPDPIRLPKLLDRMEQHARTLFRHHSLHFTMPELIPDLKVSGDLQRNIFLLFKEILQNIVRHAEATHVGITCTCAGGTLTIQVEDNGVGFDPAQAYDGFGLRNMRHRGRAGDLTIDSQPGAGTTVTYRVKIA